MSARRRYARDDLVKDGRRNCQYISDVRGRKDSGYESQGILDEYYLDSDVESEETDEVHPIEPLTPEIPEIPQRSAKRTARIIDRVLIPSASYETIIPVSAADQQTLANPHETYLSSEEDLSFSDEYYDDDSLLDFTPPTTEGGEDEANLRLSRNSSWSSQIETARIVSLSSQSKPQIVSNASTAPKSQRRRAGSSSNSSSYKESAESDEYDLSMESPSPSTLSTPQTPPSPMTPACISSHKRNTPS